jgi:hypothetical protein
MNQPYEPDESERRHHLMDEEDIGSGEKTPAEKETEEEIRKIPPLPSEPPKPS